MFVLYWWNIAECSLGYLEWDLIRHRGRRPFGSVNLGDLKALKPECLGLLVWPGYLRSLDSLEARGLGSLGSPGKYDSLRRCRPEPLRRTLIL